MRSADKKRFEELVEEEKFDALARLCASQIEKNEKLSKENTKLQEDKLKILTRAWEAYKADPQIAFSATCIVLLSAFIILTLTWFGINLLTSTSPPQVTNEYSIETCNEDYGVMIIQQVNRGENIRHTGCLMDSNKNEVARETLLLLQENNK